MGQSLIHGCIQRWALRTLISETKLNTCLSTEYTRHQGNIGWKIYKMNIGNVNDRWIWLGAKPTAQPTRVHFTQTPSLSTSTTHFDLNLKRTSSQLHNHVTNQETEINNFDHTTNHPLIPWLWDYDTLFEYPEPNTEVDQLETNMSEGEFSTWSWRANQTLVTDEDLSISTTFNMNGIDWADTTVNFLKDLYSQFHTSKEPWSLPTNNTSANYSSIHLLLTSTPYLKENYGNYSHLNSSKDMSELQHNGILHYILSSVVISILVILLFVSIVTNSLILATILIRNYLRKTFFSLYISLAASDLIASIFTVPVVILCILKPNALPLEACTLMTAAVVLTMYVSVGSIASLCAVRWWQFYNFSEIRSWERIAICFTVLGLWISGFGITSGFVLQDTSNMNITCRLDYITAIFHKTLPFTSVSVSVGLLITFLLNYLIVRKIKKKSIYSHRHRGSMSSLHAQADQIKDQTLKSLRVQDNFTSYVNTPKEYQNISTSILNCNTNKTFQKNASILEDGTMYETRRNEGLKSRSSNNSTRERLPTKKKGDIYKKLRSDHISQHPSRDPRILDTQKKISPSSDLCLDKVLVTAETFLDFHLTDTDQKESIFKGPTNVMHDYKCCESDLESEHLYEVIEPLDMQEQIPQNTDTNSGKLLTAAISLPNAVENYYNTNPVIRKHQTTIINMASAPDDHVVKTLAWIKNDNNFLPSPTFKNDANNFNKTTFNNTEQTKNTTKEIMIQDSLLPLKVPLNFTTHTRVENAQSANISTFMSPKNKWGCIFDPVQEISKGRKFFPLKDVKDAQCPDLSAQSSKQSTTHQKLSREQQAVRMNTLATACTISGLVAAKDSEDEERSNFVFPTPRAGQSSHDHSSSHPQPISSGNPQFGMHPVHQKCIQISCHLIAIFVAAYLPLLAFQIALSQVKNNFALFLMMTYKILLQALHPTFYVLQSPVLTNALRKMVKISRFSTLHNTAHQQRTSSFILKCHKLGTQIRPSSHPLSSKPASFSDSKIRPWSNTV